MMPPTSSRPFTTTNRANFFQSYNLCLLISETMVFRKPGTVAQHGWETYLLIDVTRKTGFPSHSTIHKLELVSCILWYCIVWLSQERLLELSWHSSCQPAKLIMLKYVIGYTFYIRNPGLLTIYWPMILMAPCIIDFIGANALLGPVGGRGPWTLLGP
jgi:hypothetical protein